MTTSLSVEAYHALLRARGTCPVCNREARDAAGARDQSAVTQSPEPFTPVTPKEQP